MDWCHHMEIIVITIRSLCRKHGSAVSSVSTSLSTPSPSKSSASYGFSSFSLIAIGNTIVITITSFSESYHVIRSLCRHTWIGIIFSTSPAHHHHLNPRFSIRASFSLIAIGNTIVITICSSPSIIFRIACVIRRLGRYTWIHHLVHHHHLNLRVLTVSTSPLEIPSLSQSAARQVSFSESKPV